MRIITAERRKINDDYFVRNQAKKGDCSIQIPAEDYIIKDQHGNLVCIHKVLDAKFCSDVIKQVQKIKTWVKAKRSNGMTNVSKTFGFQPRQPEKTRDFCSSSDLHFTDMGMVRYLEELVLIMQGIYREHAPEVFAMHKKWTDENVLPCWHLGGTPFTSGIINNGNALRYPRDIGNIPGAWSNMLVLKHNLASDESGGNLCLPEFDSELIFTNGSMLMFNGAELMHGVTPYKKARPSGNRYSIVFYTLQKMQSCLTAEEEKKRFLQYREQVEMEKYEKLKATKNQGTPNV